MRTILKIMAVVGFMFGVGILEWIVRGQATSDQSASGRTSDVGPILQRIHTLSSLTTLRVEVADALVTELRGRMGGISAVLVVHGEATLTVDLSEAKFQLIDPTAHTAVLLLPQPRVQIVKLDHHKTKLIGLSTSGLWMIVPGGDDADAAISDLAYQRGEELVAVAAADPELTEQAERVLKTFLASCGLQVEIRWSIGFRSGSGFSSGAGAKVQPDSPSEQDCFSFRYWQPERSNHS